MRVSGRILLLNSHRTNTYVGLADNASDLSGNCDYGLKSITRIELDDTHNILNLDVANFDVSNKHAQSNSSPTTLSFKVLVEGSGWSNEKNVGDRSNSSSFEVTLQRAP
jgi:hypothetical protein